MTNETTVSQPRTEEQPTSENGGITRDPDKRQSSRHKHKSPGRVAWMKRLHEEGRAFNSGGPRPKHGIRALEDRLRRGLDPGSPLAVLHAEREAAYLQDLGGSEQCSNMERGIAARLADLDLVRGMLASQRLSSKHMSFKVLHDHVQAVTRNVVAYVTAAKAIGPGRRQKDTEEIVIRRWADEPADGKAGTEHGIDKE